MWQCIECAAYNYSNPPAAPTVTLPAGLPATLDCASADSYSQTMLLIRIVIGTWISGTLSPTVTNSFDACMVEQLLLLCGTDAVVMLGALHVIQ